MTKKAKIVSLILCAALILSLGAVAAYAATNEGGFPFLTFGKAGGISVRSDDDGFSFSTDGGETWGEEIPANATYETTEDGETFTITVDIDE